jgi:REP element-mobilizing transposase RayT
MNDTRLHRRRSIRVQGYDYRADGAYFVTIVTQNRLPLFGRIVGDGMILNRFGEIVMCEWHNTASRRPYVNLDEFVVMPNHVHGIIWLTGDRALHDRGTARCPPTGDAGLEDAPARTFGSMVPGSVSSIIRGFKSAVTRRVNDLRHRRGAAVWQRNYYERVIRDDRELREIRQYIIDNPARWALDKDFIEA